MFTQPEAFGMSVNAVDIEAIGQFYASFYPHDKVFRSTFAGIPYISLMRDGETLVNIFQKGPNNSLSDSLATIKVDSVPAFEAQIKASGGSVLLSSGTCPCTDAAFSVCVDPSGNQFMIKEPRADA
ncbi:MAG: VOC family protein [Caldilineaceae bacterium]